MFQFTIKFVLVWSLLLLSQFLFGQFVKYSNDFLSIGTGAREMALGKAAVSVTSDASAVYWCPAQMSGFNSEFTASATHIKYFGGAAVYDYVGFVNVKPDSSAFAAGIVRLGTDNIPNTLQLFDSAGNISDNINYFSVADYALFLSFSKKMTNLPLVYGASLKLIYRKTGPFANAYGFGTDFSLSYNKNKFSSAIIIRDAFTTFNAWFINKNLFDSTFLATGNTAPENSIELTAPSIQVGLNYSFAVSSKISINPVLGFFVFTDGKRNALLSGKYGTFDPVFGMETSYLNIVYVRFGLSDFFRYNSIFSSEIDFVPSLGIGIKYFNINFDYTYTNAGKTTLQKPSNIFSVSWKFKK